MEDNIDAKIIQEDTGKKRNFFKRLQRNKRGQILFFVISMTVLVALYIPLLTLVQNNRIMERCKNISVKDDNQILFSIENIENEKNNFLISGWMFQLDTQTSDIQLFVRRVGTEKLELIKTELKELEGISEYYVSNWDFGKYGFESKVNLDNLEDNICYEIIMALTYSKLDYLEDNKVTKLISSKQYIYNEEIYQYNPLEFFEPNIIDTELRKVIDYGRLKAYSKEEAFWVYQYENKLYFILDSKFGLLSEADISIPIMPRTTRVDLLPEHRIQYGYDHLGTLHEDESYIREGIETYQIAVIELPTNYPMTYITTGLYESAKSEWKCDFMISMTDWKEYKKGE